MALSDFALRHPLRVRWAEVDPQGIVFNPNYLMYCDVAITEYWREVGIAYPEGFLALGIDTVVVKASLEYKAPARFDDEVVVAARVARIGRTSLGVAVEIVRGTEILVGAEIVYVIVTKGDHRPTPAPAFLIERIEAFEVRAPERAATNGA